MARFVFSADGHVVEPRSLYQDGLPPSLQKYGLRSEVQGDFTVLLAGDHVLRRAPRRPPSSPELANFSRPNQKGGSDVLARLEDLQHEGIDAEIAFPTAGLMSFMLINEEAELATAQLYNDWNSNFFGSHLTRFVRCGILPVRNFDYTVREMKRIAELGFTAAMLPSVVPNGVPNYNDDAWSPVFEAGEQLGIVFVLHTGTGRPDVRPEKGAGGAVINYAVQMCDAQYSVMYLVAGGVLDRFPGAKVAVIECGASWLAALAERMDEAYEAHQIFVRPKLSLSPREIMQRQISASFQYDRAGIMSRAVTGVQSLMWAADYPHHEGTFPRSREVVAGLFDGIDISESDKDAILGGNAARLFRLPRPDLADSSLLAEPSNLR